MWVATMFFLQRSQTNLPSRELTYPPYLGIFESMIFLFPRWDICDRSLGGYKVSHITPYRKPIEIIIPKKFPEVWTRNEKTLEDSDTMIQTKKQRKEIETRKTNSEKKLMVYVYVKKNVIQETNQGVYVFVTSFFSLIWSPVNRFFLCAVCSIFRVVQPFSTEAWV